jgi:uroporphyrinogen decarboxylase
MPTPRERVAAALRREPVDRIPWSFWRHFYDREQTAQDTAAAMVSWVRRWRFDFLKLNPRAHYHAEPWGAVYRYSGGEHDRPTAVALPVRGPDDWQRIHRVDPGGSAFGEQLETVRLARQELGDDVPILQTIFTPLAVLGYVAEPGRILADIREAPVAVHAALDAVADTLALYAAECLRAGADGIFFATTAWATRQALTSDEYAIFGRPYDVRVLHAVRNAAFNVLHVCRDENMLFDLLDYPVHAFNWAATSPSNPSLGAVLRRLEHGAVIGGVGHDALTDQEPTMARDQVRRAFADTGGRGWMAGGDCSIPTHAREANIAAVRAELDRLAVI